MKHRFMIWAHWAVLLLMVLSFAACGSDGGGDNGEGSGSTVTKNENQNPASGYNTNKTSLKAAQRMEFPNIKKPAANYYVIVHTLSGTANQYSYAGKTIPSMPTASTSAPFGTRIRSRNSAHAIVCTEAMAVRIVV